MHRNYVNRLNEVREILEENTIETWEAVDATLRILEEDATILRDEGDSEEIEMAVEIDEARDLLERASKILKRVAGY